MTIPFLARFHQAIRSGEKTMTCRTKRYGAPGHVLTVLPLDTEAGPLNIRIVTVQRETLGVVASHFYIEEGCASPDEFQAIWLTIHRGFNAEQKVWLHQFTVEP